MTDIILLITQWSATLTSVAALVAFVLMFLVSRRLARDRFRDTILFCALFLFVSLVGVTSMTVYHFTEEVNEETAEFAEGIWYLLMFIALLVSVYVSRSVRSFGEIFGKK